MGKLTTWLRYFARIKGEGKFYPDSTMKITNWWNFNMWEKEDLERVIDLGFQWGDYHPDNLQTYFNKSKYPIISDTEGLLVSCVYDPKEFTLSNGNKITIPRKQDVLRTKQKFSYGYFEATIKLPSSKYAWPAFWMTGSINWPPEIDILEGYSNDTTNYGWWIFPSVKLQSNVHYKDNNGNHKHIGGQDHPLPKDVTKNFNKYGVLWLPNKIEFYYNRYLMRSITDKNILNKLTEPMEVIFNLNVQKEGGTGLSNNMSMNVKNLCIWQLK